MLTRGTWKFRDLELAILDWIMKHFQRIISGMEPSFKPNNIGKTPNTGQEAVRSYWCPEHNLSSFIICIYMKAALGQVGECVQLCI